MLSAAGAPLDSSHDHSYRTLPAIALEADDDRPELEPRCIVPVAPHCVDDPLLRTLNEKSHLILHLKRI